jgi:transcriptional regulator with XRE-family HTH domain
MALETLDLMTFGQRLRNARDRMDLSQADLAARVRTRQETISSYEIGNSLPSLARLYDLAQVLHVDIAYFFPDCFPKDPQSATLPPYEWQEFFSTLSPVAQRYLLTVVEYLFDFDERRRFMQDVFPHPDARLRLIHFLRRDLRQLEAVLDEPVWGSERLHQTLVHFTVLSLVMAELQQSGQATLLDGMDLAEWMKRNAYRLADRIHHHMTLRVRA